MGLDGLVLRALVQELKTLEGSRVNKIHQPSALDVVFTLHTKQGNRQLLLSPHPALPRVYLTEIGYENPAEPPAFCMVLRKHLEGSILEQVSQAGLDRILQLEFRGRNEIGDTTVKRLILEIMSKHSNLVLVAPESGRILDGLRHVTPSISQYRTVLPGHTYIAPPEQHKADPLSIDSDRFLTLLQFNQGRLEQQLVGAFAGIGPGLAREILYRAGLPTRENLWHAFCEVIKPLRQHDYAPSVVQGKGGRDFHVIPLFYLDGERTGYESVSRSLEAFYHEKSRSERIKQQATDLLRWSQNEWRKAQEKVEKLKATLAQADEAETFRLYGELLTAYQHAIQPGMASVQLPNFYDPAQQLLEISLDPSLSANENAQWFFKRYNKAKNSRQILQQQIEQTEADILYLETIHQQLQEAEGRESEEIREELVEEGYLRDRRGKGRKKKQKFQPSQPQKWLSSEGIPIYVGKNNRQNDELTMRLAKPEDTWLHTQNIPGSHVIIRAAQPSQTTLMEAAQLAAYFSKAKHSSQVPVDYTLVKHVRKPKGAKAGFVHYTQQKTLYVTPDESQIHQLLSQKG